MNGDNFYIWYIWIDKTLTRLVQLKNNDLNMSWNIQERWNFRQVKKLRFWCWCLLLDICLYLNKDIYSLTLCCKAPLHQDRFWYTRSGQLCCGNALFSRSAKNMLWLIQGFKTLNMTWKKVSGIHTLLGSVIVKYFSWPE